jgi:hypothetical protein
MSALLAIDIKHGFSSMLFLFFGLDEVEKQKVKESLCAKVFII